jgi:hypothetical protein
MTPETDQPLPGTPAEPGNTLAVKAGWSSPRIVEARCAVINEAVISEAPWLVAPIFAATLDRYCTATAISQLVAQYVLDHPTTITARMIDASSTALRTAQALSNELGLSPMSQARLRNIVSDTAATNAAAAVKSLQTKGADAWAKRGLRVVTTELEEKEDIE